MEPSSALATPKRITILGSTGSIGTQALDVVRQHPSRFSIVCLVAQSNWRLLVEQALEFKPEKVVITSEQHYPEVRAALKVHGIEVMTGDDAMTDVLDAVQADMVLLSVVGAAGLRPALKAATGGIDIALANKESLVAGGHLVMAAAARSGSRIIPVDSEHSAIFQCLAGEDMAEVSELILTASGGPFLGKDRKFLETVGPEQAIRHPNWSMGCKVSVDSATMMNKGLEMIEAHWLFGLPSQRIRILVHPQSVVHSMVTFIDGSMKAQLGITDMRLPIQYALSWPRRLTGHLSGLDLCQYPGLTFQPPDNENFRNLAIAYEAIDRGGTMPCVMNAANEMAVKAFLKKGIRFTDIPLITRAVMDSAAFEQNPDLDCLLEADREARFRAMEIINKKEK